MQIKIQIVDGDKQANLEINDADNISKLMIIQNVFQIFGISTDILEVSKTYSKIEDLYKGFFNDMKPEEPECEQVESKHEDIKEVMTETLQDNQLQEIYTSENENTDIWRTGTKERDGQTVYLCHYYCSICGDRGNHYLPEGTTEVKCRSCRSSLKVYAANPNGFPERDNFGNYLRAGDFKDRRLWD
jgi:rubrerythrin